MKWSYPRMLSDHTLQAFLIQSISVVWPLCLIPLDFLILTQLQMLNKIKWTMKELLSHRTTTILRDSPKCLSCIRVNAWQLPVAKFRTRIQTEARKCSFQRVLLYLCYLSTLVNASSPRIDFVLLNVVLSKHEVHWIQWIRKFPFHGIWRTASVV
jgi:hypothetical protein